MSATLKTLTGAALAAAITLGGLTSAYAQFIQPYNEPFSDEPVIEDVVTDEDESLDGLKPGLWIYNGDRMTFGHEWVGLAGGTLVVSGLYHNFWDIYHKGGSISARSFDMDIDRLWVTLDTLGDSDPFKSNRDGALDIDTFILQVGETNVHGETFGSKTADKKLVLAPGKNNRDYNKDITTITYGGKKFNPLGVKGGTKVMVKNYSGGIISDIEVQSGSVQNYSGGVIKDVEVQSGSLENSGQIKNATQTGGNARNEGHIDNFVMSGPNSKFTNDGGIDKFVLSGGGEVTITSNSKIGCAWFTAPDGSREREQVFTNFGCIGFLEADAGPKVGTYADLATVKNLSGGCIGNAFLHGKTDFHNGKNGTIDYVDISDPSSRFTNYQFAYVDQVTIGGGRVENSGTIGMVILRGTGILNNKLGRIDTLVIYNNGGTIEALGDVGVILYRGTVDEGVIDNAAIDEGYVDEGFSDNADFDNAGWQDAAPLGEEVMVW